MLAFMLNVYANTAWAQTFVLLFSSLYATSTIERLRAIGTAALVLAIGLWVKRLVRAIEQERPDLAGLSRFDRMRARAGEATCSFLGHSPKLYTFTRWKVTHDGTEHEEPPSREVRCSRCLTQIGD